MHELLMASLCFSVMLVITRIIFTGHITYIFMIWNLFLGYIPYGITRRIIRNPWVIEKKLLLSLALGGWLLFIPNTFYILTDLFHLEEFDTAPKWFDLLLLFSFAWNGLLLGIISIRKVEQIVEWAVNRKLSLLLVFAVMWLNAFGVYIGRYLRYNSWDVITKPFSLFSELFTILTHPISYRMEWSMIMGYALFMTLLYITIKKLAESFNHHEIKTNK